MPTPRTRSPKSSKAAQGFTPPYPPSWFDRLTAWVDRQPGPAWAFYIVLGIALSVAGSAVQWREGAYPAGSFNPAHVWTLGSIAYVLALMHYLDKTAASAIASFRPLLVSANDGPRASVRDQALFARLSYELTTLPPWPTFIATLLGAVFAILPFLQTSTGSLVRRSTEGVPSFLAGTAGTELSNVTMVSSFFLQSAIFGVLIYHTLHQLLLISRIYTQHARINIYRLQPLYALSLPCALTGIGIILWLSTWLAASPSSVQAVGPGEIVFLVPIVAVAGATFVLPLWGAHRRLVAEKDRRLAESSSLFEDTTSELHRQLYRGRLHRMDQLNRALANLEIEQVALRRIPTWPWQPGTVRGLGAALLLPLVAWGLQQWLGRLLGA